jgi:hypothetical protein
MKKFLFLFFAMSCLVGFLNAQEVLTLLSEGFEGEQFPPEGWTNPYGWWRMTEAMYNVPAHTGGAFAASGGYYAVVQDYYLFTPALEIPEESEVNLNYFVDTQNYYHPISYSVMVTTADPMLDFYPLATEVIFTEQITGNEEGWRERNLDLTEYAGRTVYVAFIMHQLGSPPIQLDDVTVTATVPTLPPPPPPPDPDDVFFAESFDSEEFPPTGWTTTGHVGWGERVVWQHSTSEPFAGTGCAVAENGYAMAVVNQTYFVTPPIELDTNDEIVLRYYVSIELPEPVGWYYGSSVMYKVHVSTAYDFSVSDYTSHLFMEVLNADNTPNWQERNINLSQFAGQTVYIAFNLWGGSPVTLKIDEVSVGNVGDQDITFNVAETDTVERPVATRLSNYPNPFNPSTTISFTVGKAFMHSENNVGGTDKSVPYNVRIDIYNIKGQKIRNLVNGQYGAGEHKVVWNGTDDNGAYVSGGVYFYRMKAGEITETKKMMLMK